MFSRGKTGRESFSESHKSRCYKSSDEYLPRFLDGQPSTESDINNKKKSVGQEKDKHSLIIKTSIGVIGSQ